VGPKRKPFAFSGRPLLHSGILNFPVLRGLAFLSLQGLPQTLSPSPPPSAALGLCDKAFNLSPDVLPFLMDAPFFESFTVPGFEGPKLTRPRELFSFKGLHGGGSFLSVEMTAEAEIGFLGALSARVWDLPPPRLGWDTPSRGGLKKARFERGGQGPLPSRPKRLAVL